MKFNTIFKKLLLLVILVSAGTASAKLQSESILINDDGSLTILRPTWTDDHQTLSLHEKLSDMNELCSQFHALRVVTWKKTKKKESVVSYRSFNHVSLHPTKDYAVEYLVCSTNLENNITRYSARYESLNDLGANLVQIIEPTFGQLDGLPVPFSYYTDINGLCRLYGFERMARGQEVLYREEKKQTLAVINGKGALNYLDDQSKKAVSSIQCVRSLEFKLMNRLDLDQLSGALRDIAKVSRPSVADLFNKIANQLDAEVPIAAGLYNRTLKPSQITLAHTYRIAALHLLSPIFMRSQSAWFVENVKPVYVNERMPQVFQLTSQKDINDMQRGPGPAMDVSLWVITNVLHDMKKRTSYREERKWIDSILVQTNKFKVSKQSSSDLQEWIYVWSQGEVYVQGWLGLIDVQLSVESLLLSAEWLKSCI